MEAIIGFYIKNAPRWIKVIKWDKFVERFIANQRSLAKYLYIPCFLAYHGSTLDKFSVWLYFNRPKTQEEFDAGRRAYFLKSGHDHVRNYLPGQYYINKPPLYDLSQRRKLYPEHYGDQYDGFKRYGDEEFRKVWRKYKQ